MTVSPGGAAALAYAQRGWRVVPSWAVMSDGTCECPNADCTRQGKHPRVRAWQDVATTDFEAVAGWWAQWPHANVSIVTGVRSGLLVVDVDVKGGGFASVEEYERMSVVGLPTTMTATTGSGGRHLFYRWPKWAVEEGVVVRNLVGWLPGVDVRCEGGQVVAPPSPHKSGGFYTWTDGWDEGPADAPEELVRALLRAMAEGRGGARGGHGPGGDLPSGGDILAGVPEGERNDTLFRWACKLRRQLRDDRPAVEVLVRQAGVASGMAEGELVVLLDSAFKQKHDLGFDATQAMWAGMAVAGSMGERVEPGSGGAGGGPGTTEGLEAEDRGWNPGDLLPPSDLGNAERLFRWRGEDMRWSQGRGWCVWDGRRWRVDTTRRAVALAQRVSGLVMAEAEGLDEEEEKTRAVLMKWALRSQGAGAVDACLRMTEPLVAVEDEEFDRDPWLFNCSNGTVDLRSGRVRPHRREDLLTVAAPVRWDESAACPGWEAFVEMVLPEQGVRWFVQKAVGYSLTGVVDAKAMFVLHGGGNNGKSVFLEALRLGVFGPYAETAAKSVVMKGREDHQTTLASLAGARFVTLAEEVSPSDRLDVGWLKSVTGGDLMKARFMRKDEFSFTPQMKLWVGTNHKPGLTEFGSAVKDRLRLVPFTEVIGPDRRRDRAEVMTELLAERDGILRWAADGLAGYLREGLGTPSGVSDAVDEWMDEDDTVGLFLMERCVEGGEGVESGWSTLTELYTAYAAWAGGMGERAMSRKTFMRDLQSKPIARKGKGERSATKYALVVRNVGIYGV